MSGSDGRSAARAAGARRGWEKRREENERATREVEAKDPSLLALWEAEKGRFRGSFEARAEAFLEWALDHGSAIEAALEEQGERLLVQRLAQLGEWEEVDLEDEDVTWDNDVDYSECA